MRAEQHECRLCIKHRRLCSPLIGVSVNTGWIYNGCSNLMSLLAPRLQFWSGFEWAAQQIGLIRAGSCVDIPIRARPDFKRIRFPSKAEHQGS